MDSRQPMEDEIDLRVLLQTLWRRRLTILAVTVVSALVTAGVSFFVLPPVYESRTQILLSENSAPVYATAEAAVRFLTGRSFLAPIAGAFGIRVTNRLVSASPVRDTRIVDLRIRYSDRERLQTFTDAVIREFMKLSSQRIDARRRTAESRLAAVDSQIREFERTLRMTRQTLERIGSGISGDATSWFARSVILNSIGTSEGLYSGLLNAQRDLRNEILALEPPALIQAPYIPSEAVSPRSLLNVILAAMFGLMAGSVLAFIIEAFRSPSAIRAPAQPGPVGSMSLR